MFTSSLRVFVVVFLNSQTLQHRGPCSDTVSFWRCSWWRLTRLARAGEGRGRQGGSFVVDLCLLER